jgi:hypothetical protein
MQDLEPSKAGFSLIVTTDTKIQDVAVRYIRKAIGNRDMLTFESLGTLHPLLARCFAFQDGELVLVSAFFSSESWYVFTTRRIISLFEGALQSLDPSDGVEAVFPNFKGYALDEDDCEPDDGSENRKPAVIPCDIATITSRVSRAVVRFEYRTWQGSTLPMYAAMYWQVKHPFLNKFMTTVELEDYRTRNG